MLWYYQIVEGQRTDLKVIYADLLDLKWYRENLRNKYPDLKIDVEEFSYDSFIRNNNNIYDNRENPVFISEYNSQTLPIIQIKT